MLNNFLKIYKIQHNSNLDKVDVVKLIIIIRMTVKHINAICNLYQSDYVGFQYYKCIIIVWNAFIKAQRKVKNGASFSRSSWKMFPWNNSL